MANQINSSASLWKQSQSDIFADGKNDQSSANAGAIVTASLAEGQAQTTAAIDGNLASIDTGAESLSLDPAENTGGNAVRAHSSTFLLRWGIKLLQGISGKLPALVGGKIPVDGATAGDIGSAVDVALKASPQPISAIALPLPTGAATESTLNSVLLQLQGDRAITSNLFIDATDTIYLRVLAFNQQTNAYESSAISLTGTAYTPTAPETPLQREDYDTTETVWEIVTSDSGYTVGDIVSQFSLITQGPPIAIGGVLWFNQNTQLAISAPLPGHRRRSGALAATESTLSALNGKIAPLGQAVMAASSPVAIASDQAPIPVTIGSDQITTFTQAGVIAINTDLLIIDCQNIEAVSIHCLSMGTAGVVTASWSNTNNAPTDFINQSIMTPAGVAAATFNAAGLWVSTKLARFLRLRLTTATTGGTTTINVLRVAQGLNFPVQVQPVSGSVTVSSLPATPNGGNVIGDVGGSPRSGAGGLSLPNRLASSAASTNGTVVKANAGRIYKIVGYNNSATLRFLKLHNSATVTPGTTAVVSTYALKPNDYFNLDFGLIGQSQATGICYSITANAAENDATPIAAGDIVGLNVWFA